MSPHIKNDKLGNFHFEIERKVNNADALNDLLP